MSVSYKKLGVLAAFGVLAPGFAVYMCGKLTQTSNSSDNNNTSDDKDRVQDRVQDGELKLVDNIKTVLLVNRSVKNCENNIQTISLKNTGLGPISNIVVTLDKKLLTDAKVTSTTDCPEFLTPSQTCTVTFIPNSNNLQQGTISITGTLSNGTTTSPINLGATVLGYSTDALIDPIIYQEGYVYHLECKNNVFNEGRVVALEDQGAKIKWSTDNSGGQSAANFYNGFENMTHLTETKFAAAKVCAEYNSGNYKDWYLPAICEMGPLVINGICVNDSPNMVTNLFKLRQTSFDAPIKLAGEYWSSTYAHTNTTWYQYYAVDTKDSIQKIGLNKSTDLHVRCSRRITR